MNSTGYLVFAACVITVFFLVFIFRRRRQFKSAAPLFPYYSVSDPAIRVEDAVSNFEFERHIVKQFDKSQFTLFYWKGNKNGEVAVASPVLEFDFIASFPAIPVAVECRWKKDIQEGGVCWASHHEIDRYKNYERESKRIIFIIIGIGGTPVSPEKVFSIPLSKIPRHMDLLSNEFLCQYARPDAAATFAFNKQTMRLT